MLIIVALSEFYLKLILKYRKIANQPHLYKLLLINPLNVIKKDKYIFDILFLLSLDSSLNLLRIHLRSQNLDLSMKLALDSIKSRLNISSFLSNNLALVYHHFGYPILYQISD
jgi:hypothetical protein